MLNGDVTNDLKSFVIWYIYGEIPNLHDPYVLYCMIGPPLIVSKNNQKIYQSNQIQ